MTPVTRKVRVKVPATSANLGSGFDTVGLALDYHDELEFTLSADPVNTAAQVMIEGEGEDTLPRDETHLVVSTFRRACQTFGLAVWASFFRLTTTFLRHEAWALPQRPLWRASQPRPPSRRTTNSTVMPCLSLPPPSKAIRTTWLRPCTAGSPCLGTWKPPRCRFRADSGRRTAA